MIRSLSRRLTAAEFIGRWRLAIPWLLSPLPKIRMNTVADVISSSWIAAPAMASVLIHHHGRPHGDPRRVAISAGGHIGLIASRVESKIKMLVNQIRICCPGWRLTASEGARAYNLMRA
jgi:hypothetical protein